MNLYSKLRLLMQVKAEAPVRQLIDQHDIQIFEQEIRATQGLIRQNKLHLASIKADIALLAQSVEEQHAEIHAREQQALEALEKDESLAHDLAAKIAEDEIELNARQKRLGQLKATEQRVTANLKQAVRVIKNHQQHLVVLKANEAQDRLHGKVVHGGGSLNLCITELNASLKNIQERQLRLQTLDTALVEIDEDLEGGDLDARVKAAGISSGQHDARAVLDRLRKVRQAAV